MSTDKSSGVKCQVTDPLRNFNNTPEIYIFDLCNHKCNWSTLNCSAKRSQSFLKCSLTQWVTVMRRILLARMLLAVNPISVIVKLTAPIPFPTHANCCITGKNDSCSFLNWQSSSLLAWPIWTARALNWVQHSIYPSDGCHPRTKHCQFQINCRVAMTTG